jgi:hypothetical protein
MSSQGKSFVMFNMSGEILFCRMYKMNFHLCAAVFANDSIPGTDFITKPPTGRSLKSAEDKQRMIRYIKFFKCAYVVKNELKNAEKKYMQKINIFLSSNDNENEQKNYY